MAYSGGRGSDVFRVEENIGGTGYDFFQVDGTTAATTNAHKSFGFDNVEDQQTEYTTEGTANVNLVNYNDDETLLTMKNALVKPPASNAINLPDYYKDDGVKVSASGATQDAVLITYLSLNSAGTKRKVLIIFGNFDPASGGSSHKATDHNKPPFKFLGKKNEHAVSVDDALFDATKVTVAAPITIPAFSCFVETFIAVAA